MFSRLQCSLEGPLCYFYPSTSILKLICSSGQVALFRCNSVDFLFSGQIVSLLQSLPQSTDTTDSQRRLVDTATLTSDEVSEIKRLTQENERLREQLASGGGSVTEQPADDSKLRPILARAHRDVVRSSIMWFKAAEWFMVSWFQLPFCTSAAVISFLLQTVTCFSSIIFIHTICTIKKQRT